MRSTSTHTNGKRLTSDERLAVVETDIENLSADVREMSRAVHTLSETIAARGQFSWQTIGIVMAIVGAIGTAVIAPLARDVAAAGNLAQVRTEAEAASLADIRRQLSNVDETMRHYVDVEIGRVTSQATSTLEQRLQEVETQFRWMTDVTNIREREDDRKTSLLWHRVYGEDYPAATRPNVGPDDGAHR
jgi:hypothetical protein